MYGTVARMRMKPGMEQRFNDLMRDFKSRNVTGFESVYIYRLENEPNTYMMAVAFQDRESYFANANSPEQQQFYTKMVEMLEGEPEWHDGEIVAAA